MKTISVKKILSITFFTFSIPALLLLFLLTFNTIHRQSEADIDFYKSHLELYKNTVERTLNNTDTLLANIVNNNSAFQAFYYADSQLDKYLNAFEVMNDLHPVLEQEPLIGGFFLYSNTYSFYYPSYQISYFLADQQRIKKFLINTNVCTNGPNEWIPFSLSDHTVLLHIASVGDTICAAMLDPSLEPSFTSASDPKHDITLFFSSISGTPYTAKFIMNQRTFQWTKDPVQIIHLPQGDYRLIKDTFTKLDMQICFMIPYKGFFGSLNIFQRALILAIAALFLSVPFIWNYLYRILLSPLHSLAETMEKVGYGDLTLRASENLPNLELRNFSKTFNQMLHNIQNLKLQAYEKKIELQQAQLQYLQLQIRPHFYLNCLKGLYSMAEKKQYKEIQEMLLSLSDYLRYIFRNNMKFVSLSQEVHSVTSYIKLLYLNFSRSPQLTMDIAANVAEYQILPLSLLTFVENSIKHSANTTGLKIHIKAQMIYTEEGNSLNLTVSDNGGGFSPESLNILNHLSEHKTLYDDYHVGISNIYYRMKLTYGQKGMLAFYNLKDGGCVELFIPVKEEHKDECTNS